MLRKYFVWKNRTCAGNRLFQCCLFFQSGNRIQWPNVENEYLRPALWCWQNVLFKQCNGEYISKENKRFAGLWRTYYSLSGQTLCPYVIDIENYKMSKMCIWVMQHRRKTPVDYVIIVLVMGLFCIHYFKGWFLHLSKVTHSYLAD